MLLQYNPTYQGVVSPWAGQGDVIETSTDYSTAEDGENWWYRNGDEAIDIFKTVACLVKPETCRGGNGNNYQPPPPPQDNTIMYVFMGIVVVLLLVFMFKK